MAPEGKNKVQRADWRVPVHGATSGITAEGRQGKKRKLHEGINLLLSVTWKNKRYRK